MELPWKCLELRYCQLYNSSFNYFKNFPSNYYYYYVFKILRALWVYANAKTQKDNKIQLKQEGYRNKNVQSGEDKCSREETLKLWFLENVGFVASPYRNFLNFLS